MCEDSTPPEVTEPGLRVGIPHPVCGLIIITVCVGAYPLRDLSLMLGVFKILVHCGSNDLVSQWEVENRLGRVLATIRLCIT